MLLLAKPTIGVCVFGLKDNIPVGVHEPGVNQLYHRVGSHRVGRLYK